MFLSAATHAGGAARDRRREPHRRGLNHYRGCAGGCAGAGARAADDQADWAKKMRSRKSLVPAGHGPPFFMFTFALAPSYQSVRSMCHLFFHGCIQRYRRVTIRHGWSACASRAWFAALRVCLGFEISICVVIAGRRLHRTRVLVAFVGPDSPTLNLVSLGRLGEKSSASLLQKSPASVNVICNVSVASMLKIACVVGKLSVLMAMFPRLYLADEDSGVPPLKLGSLEWESWKRGSLSSCCISGSFLTWSRGRPLSSALRTYSRAWPRSCMISYVSAIFMSTLGSSGASASEVCTRTKALSGAFVSA